MATNDSSNSRASDQTQFILSLCRFFNFPKNKQRHQKFSREKSQRTNHHHSPNQTTQTHSSLTHKPPSNCSMLVMPRPTPLALPLLRLEASSSSIATAASPTSPTSSSSRGRLPLALDFLPGRPSSGTPGWTSHQPPLPPISFGASSTLGTRTNMFLSGRGETGKKGEREKQKGEREKKKERKKERKGERETDGDGENRRQRDSPLSLERHEATHLRLKLCLIEFCQPIVLS